MHLLRITCNQYRMLVSQCLPACSYENAVDKLSELQSVANVVSRCVKDKQAGQSSDRDRNVEVTRVYLQRLGITSTDLKSLNVIHVAGTKGKGSTCALTESILRHSGYTTGFFSSPHLMEIRERIRLNGQVVSRDLFGRYFHEIWEKLGQCHIENEDKEPPRYPSFIKYLVVMSYYVFLKEKVDVAVVEVGLGGRHDCTNVIDNPLVTAITHLGYDHCSILGNTIEEITWVKAGIMKPGVPVFIAQQHYSATLPVLQSEAAKHSAPILTVPPLCEYPNVPASALSSETRACNVSLAIQLARYWLTTIENGPINESRPVTANPFILPPPFLKGIDRCQWPGRNHVVYRSGVTFYLDGAHTPVSIQMCSKWFRKCVEEGSGSDRQKILIANTTRDRQIRDFLDIITREVSLDQVIFCPNIASNNYVVKDCEWPEDMKLAMVKKAEENRRQWSSMTPQIPAFSFSTVEEAVRHVESSGREANVLVTGSIHLIGATLHVLQPNFLDEQIMESEHTLSESRSE